MFSKVQREELNALSEKVHGATSRWQKMLKNKNYWVPTGSTEKVTKKNFFVKSKGIKKTLIGIDKALASGQLKPGDHPATYEQERQILREPNFEELKETLTYMLDAKMVSRLMAKGSPEDVRFVYAYRFFKEELRYSFGLQKTTKLDKEAAQDPIEAQKAMVTAQEEYEKDFGSLLDRIDDEKLVDRIKDAVVEPKLFAKLGGFEAIDFATDVLFCKSQPDVAKEQYDAVVKDAEALLKVS